MNGYAKAFRQSFPLTQFGMTVVEFFDKVSIDNMISCITIRPEKIIFIGETKPMKKQQEAYRRFTHNQGIEVEFEYRAINKNSIENIIQVLETILETEPEVVFDLTGGEDLVLVAMGMVYQKHKDEKSIQMHRFNVSTGCVADCDNDGTIPALVKPKLSVEDNILLYGGAIVPYDGEKGTYRWTLDEEFESDIQVLWGICKKDPGLWNSQLTTLSYMARQSSCEENPLRIQASADYIRSVMEANRVNFVWIKSLMSAFERYGFIGGLDDDTDMISFTFKNAQIRQCLTKEGTLLELMVYYYSISAVDKNGSRRYNDSLIGAYIDWDAALHDFSDEEKDTENEIDVILMRGLVPVFISCKNGRVDETELYKLNTVAERFGGPYSKKVLVSSYFGKSTVSGRKYFEQRAKDMKIQLIENVHELEDVEFARQIRNIIC